jgi:hypothetical protein
MKWTKALPAELRGQTDQILVDAAVAGASLDDLTAIADYRSEGQRFHDTLQMACAVQPRVCGSTGEVPTSGSSH